MALISSSVTFPSAVGLICKSFIKDSVEIVSNHIKGIVIVETNFMGTATAFAIPSG